MDTYTVEELRDIRETGREYVLLDVRTAEELAIAALPEAVHIPLNELSMRLNELDDGRDKEIVCMCHHGMRSAQAQQILLSSGFDKVRNLTGGIHAWAVEIDPDMARY